MPPPRRHGAPTQRIPSIAGKSTPPKVRQALSIRSLDPQTSLSPAQAVAVLDSRIKHVGQLNTHIADWLQVGWPSGTRTPLTTHHKPRNAVAWKSSMSKACASSQTDTLPTNRQTSGTLPSTIRTSAHELTARQHLCDPMGEDRHRDRECRPLPRPPRRQDRG